LIEVDMPTPVKLPAKVDTIIPHAEGVKSFIMRPMRKCPNFKPGQFLHLAMDEYDPSFHWPESRVFTIANSPTRRDKMRVTFSVKGKFTQRMYDEIETGDVLWIKLPYGSFSFPDDDTDVFLIAGGTGITPFVSFLEYAIDNQINTKIKLYYGVRSPEYLIFESLLHTCERKLKYFKCRIFIEKNSGITTFYSINKGMLSIQTILADITKNLNAIYYLSGPQQMIIDFRKELVGNGILENKVMIDEWE